jgi:hypothetical protein
MGNTNSKNDVKLNPSNLTVTAGWAIDETGRIFDNLSITRLGMNIELYKYRIKTAINIEKSLFCWLTLRMLI